MRVFVRRCFAGVFGRFRMRRVRRVETGAATVVFVRRGSSGGVRRTRFIQAARVDDDSKGAAPHARCEREKQAEDESRSSHKLVELFAAAPEFYGGSQFNMDTLRRANLQRLKQSPAFS